MDGLPDLAVYRRFVVAFSGGKDSGDHNHANDPEEMAARAVERMVLHKSRAGEDFGETLAGIRNNLPSNADAARSRSRWPCAPTSLGTNEANPSWATGP